MAREAYGEFTAELRRTDVISDSFKVALRLRVQAIEREAYDRGFADGRAEPRTLADVLYERFIAVESCRACNNTGWVPGNNMGDAGWPCHQCGRGMTLADVIRRTKASDPSSAEADREASCSG